METSARSTRPRAAVRPIRTQIGRTAHGPEMARHDRWRLAPPEVLGDGPTYQFAARDPRLARRAPQRLGQFVAEPDRERIAHETKVTGRWRRCLTRFVIFVVMGKQA